MINRYENIPESVARLALASQWMNHTGCLAATFAKVMSLLYEQGKKEGKSRDWLNQHPVVVMFVCQMSYLSSSDSQDRWKDCIRICEQAAKAKISEFC